MSGKEFYTICNEFIICRETLKIKKQLKIGDCSIRCTDGCLTIDQNICMDSNRITDLAEPINDSDAVTKQYVDTQIGHENLWDRDGIILYPHNITDIVWIDRIISMGGTPTTPEATINWDGSKLSLPDNINIGSCSLQCLSGCLTFGQDLCMNGNLITGLSDPVVGSGAATKDYVDTNDLWEYITPDKASLKTSTNTIWLDQCLYMGGTPAAPEFKFAWDSANSTATIDSHFRLDNDKKLELNTGGSSYLIWDSTSACLKIINPENCIELNPLTQVKIGVDGSPATPAVVFSSDTTHGFYSYSGVSNEGIGFRKGINLLDDEKATFGDSDDAGIYWDNAGGSGFNLFSVGNINLGAGSNTAMNLSPAQIQMNVGGNNFLNINNAGLIHAQAPNYDTLITNPGDLTDKKYVDDLVSSSTYWTRDPSNAALYPTTAGDDIWLPDDDKITFGNTTASPDAYIKWDSANNRLQIDADQIYYYHTWAAGTDHIFHYNYQAVSSASGTNNATNYGKYDDFRLIGSNDFTGANIHHYIYTTNTAPTDYLYGLKSHLQHQTHDGSFIANAQFYTYSSVSSGHTLTYLAGADYLTYLNGSGTISYLYASRLIYGNLNTGTIVNAYGSYYSGQIRNTGNITNVYDIYISDIYHPGSGTLTNHYGIRIASLSEATNNIPIQIDDQDNTSNLGGHIHMYDDRVFSLGDSDDVQLKWVSASNYFNINSAGSYVKINATRIELTGATGDDTCVFIGKDAGKSNTGASNTFTGYQAGASNTSGYSNTFCGTKAGFNNTTGASNVFVGDIAGYNNKSGVSNVALGQNALYSNQYGHYNMAIGRQALLRTTGSSNVGVGQNSGIWLTTGSGNTAIGGDTRASAGLEKVTLIGYYAGFATQSNYCIFIGAYAGRYETVDYKLIIDSIDRGSEANQRAQAPIYGVINSSIANQELHFNANIYTPDDLYHYFGNSSNFQIGYDSSNNYGLFKGGVDAFDFNKPVQLEETLIFIEQSSTPTNAGADALKLWVSDGTATNEFDGDFYFNQKYNEIERWGEINKLFIEHESIAASGNTSITLGTLATGESADIEVRVMGRYQVADGYCNIYDLWAAARRGSSSEAIVGDTKHSLTVGGTTSDLTFSWSISSGVMTLTITNANAERTIDVKVKWSVNRLVSQA